MSKPETPRVPVELMTVVTDYMEAKYPNQKVEIVVIAATEGAGPSIMSTMTPDEATMLMMFCVEQSMDIRNIELVHAMSHKKGEAN